MIVVAEEQRFKCNPKVYGAISKIMFAPGTTETIQRYSENLASLLRIESEVRRGKSLSIVLWDFDVMTPGLSRPRDLPAAVHPS